MEKTRSLANWVSVGFSTSEPARSWSVGHREVATRRSREGAYSFREATHADILKMKLIRDNVRENSLVSGSIEIVDYEQALFVDGKGWVCVHRGDIVGFSCGRLEQSDIWALFVDELHEGRGIGNKLMELAEVWMFWNGCGEIRLTTEAGTRAERLYRRRGWRDHGLLPSGEIDFRLNLRDQWSLKLTRPS